MKKLTLLLCGLLATSTLFAAVTGAGGGSVAVGAGQTLFVAPGGNDAAAVKGRQDLPWATVSNAVARATNGDTIRILPGWYTNTARLHGWQSNTAPVNIINKTNLMLDFTGSYHVLPSNMTSFAVIRCSNIWIFGGTFDQQKVAWPYPQYQTNGIGSVYGVWEIADSYGIHARNLQILNAWDHGWLIDSPTNNVVTTNGSVIGCRFVNCGGWPFLGPASWDGDAIISGAGWLIKDNFIANCNRGIEHYPIVTANGIYKDTLPAAVISGNVIENCWDHGISTYFSPVIIENNVITTTNANYTRINKAIEILSPDSIVQGNHVMGYHNGVTLTASATNTLVANNVFKDMPYGIYSGGQFSRVTGNTFIRVRNAVGLPTFTWNQGSFDNNTLIDCQGEPTSLPGAFSVPASGTLTNVNVENNYFYSSTNSGGGAGNHAIWVIGAQFNNRYLNNRFYGYATNMAATFSPPWISGTNSSLMWQSNHTLFFTYTLNSTTNHVKIAGP